MSAGGKFSADVVECLCDDDAETRALAASIARQCKSFQATFSGWQDVGARERCASAT